MTSYCPVPGVGPESPSDHDYAGGFATALMLKDLRLAIEAAASVDADTPIGAKARDLYEAFAAAGNGALDFSAIIRSEEHTSELQSLMRHSYAVFCLKKKTNQTENQE